MVWVFLHKLRAVFFTEEFMDVRVRRFADDVNLIGDIRIERNADVLLNACKDIGLAVNTEKTKYMEIVIEAW